MNKIANRVSFLGRTSLFCLKGGNARMDMFGVPIKWFRIGLSYPSLIADSYIESL